MEDLAALHHNLPFLLRVAVLAEVIDLGDRVERDLLRVRRDADRRLGQRVQALLPQLRDRRAARTGDRLVRVRNHAHDAPLAHQRRQRQHERHSGAVRRRDDPVVLSQILAVQLRHHQRDVRLLSEDGGVVEHDRAPIPGDRAEVAGGRRAGGNEGHVDAVEFGRRGLAHGDRFVAELEALAGGALGRQQPQLPDRKVPLLHHAQKLRADDTRRADQRDPQVPTHVAPPAPRRPDVGLPTPDGKRRSWRRVCMIRVRGAGEQGTDAPPGGRERRQRSRPSRRSSPITR